MSNTIHPSQLKELKCSKPDCPAELDIKHIPKLAPADVSPTGKPELFVLTTYICKKCGRDMQKFASEQTTDKQDPPPLKLV